MRAIEYELVPRAIVLRMARDLIRDLYTTVPIPDEPWKVHAEHLLTHEPWMALSYDILVCEYLYLFLYNSMSE